MFILIIIDKIKACNLSMIQFQNNKLQIQDPWVNRCLYFDQFELFLHTYVQNLEVGAYIRPSTFIRNPRVPLMISNFLYNAVF